MDTLIQDVRFAVRSLRKRPGYAAVATITLALGIAATATMFSLVDAVAFRPLPVDAPDRLVALFRTDEDGGLRNFSFADYRDLRAAGDAFDDVAGFTETAVSLSPNANAGAHVVWSHVVTDNYFSVLGLDPARGRFFASDGDGASITEPVVVLGHDLWRDRFDGDPSAVGRTVRLNGHPFTIVGVAPAGFSGTRLFSYAPEIWVPLGLHAQVVPGYDALLDTRSGSFLSPIARLNAGVTLAQAEAASRTVAASIAAAHPDARAGMGIEVYSNETPINPWAFSPEQLRFGGGLLLLGVGLILLIACANVANLLLARATTRRREMAVRRALGGGRGRLVRQLLTESVVLGLAGGAIAVGLTTHGVELAYGLIPPLNFAPAFEATVDGRVLGLAIAVSLATGIVFGLAPALQGSRTGLSAALRSRTTDATRTSRLRDGLVIGQIALSLVVLAAAGLLARSLDNVRTVDPGLETADRVVMRIDPELAGYDRTRTVEFYDRLMAEIDALPGVRSATRATTLPLDGNSTSATFSAEGTATAEEDRTVAWYALVGPDYFRTLGVPVLRGRDIARTDTAGVRPVAVVNRALAERLWPGETAVGRTIRIGGSDGRVADVVGLVPDGKLARINEPPRPFLALAIAQDYGSATSVVVHHAGPPGPMLRALRGEVDRLDPTVPTVGAMTLERLTARAFSVFETGAVLTGVIALLALVLAAAGLYAVITFTVAQRSRELAIRMALGARARQTLAFVVRRGLLLLVVGVGLGLAAALALTRTLSGMLYGVTPADPATFAGVVAGLAGVAALASYLPARRALRVDPMTVLREE